MEHHTTTQLQKMVADRTGKPCTSRNRASLLKRLAKMDAAKPDGLAPDVKWDGVKRVDAFVAEAAAPAPKRARKPAPAKSPIHSKPALHAPALAFVRRAMARKQPPALRELCKELEASGIKTPWGKKKWWPSSVQNLMRQVRA